MAISFDKALGIHEQAVGLRIQRAEILANNIANGDTPNYKARDIDFKSILQGVQEGQQPLPMARTHAGHNQGLIDSDFAAELMYRIPSQPSIDGNTVDVQEEMARYSKNAVDYQASFQFLNKKFKGLSNAIRGE
ncbi:flagellar basal body rod protein FlgB [Amphritea pacifica]|uniref:Flagellar basal body rod protein FlgB n=1 Tax=Amphritea pacifica TaxID=2811233 RepID=A0ABS2W5D6_9GAMM|nr:flagellar basal body rod protein FlgB [Amphritea pacifica]MBN0986796.1 flagellar basal body rod protein FlgB [Amphritea pacifica]MBN1005237.1 flagellar basal body rod protein FlgB [Amphritea pacifica]